MKLFDSELKLMEFVWNHEPISAREIALLAAEQIGWNKNTSYTILKKLVEKGALVRTEPNFTCTSLVKKEEIQKNETKNLIDRLYGGSKKAFFAAFVEENLSDEEAAELSKMIERWK